jgi:hypothetical protein
MARNITLPETKNEEMGKAFQNITSSHLTSNTSRETTRIAEGIASPFRKPATKRKRGVATSAGDNDGYSLQANNAKTTRDAYSIRNKGDSAQQYKRRKTAPTSDDRSNVVMQDVAAEGVIAQTPKCGPKTKSAVKKEREIKRDPAQARQYSEQEFQTFLDGVQNIKDWSSRNIKQKFVDLIRWRDLEGLSLVEIAARFVAQGYSERSTVTGAYVSLKYNQFAPRFYKEKAPGLLWVPASKHGKAKNVGRSASEILPDPTLTTTKINSAEKYTNENISTTLPMKTLPLPGVGYHDDNDLIVSGALKPRLPAVDPQERKVKSTNETSFIDEKLAPEWGDQWRLDDKLMHLFSMKAEPAQLIIGSKKKRYVSQPIFIG